MLNVIATTNTANATHEMLCAAQHDEGRDQASELGHGTGRVVHSLKFREKAGEAESISRVSKFYAAHQRPTQSGRNCL